MNLIDRVARFLGYRDDQPPQPPALEPAPPNPGPGPPSPWVGIAFHDAREWLRDNPNATRERFLHWSSNQYIPDVLRGAGWDGSPRDTSGRHRQHPKDLSPQQEAVADALPVGLEKAYEMHERRRQIEDPSA